LKIVLNISKKSMFHDISKTIENDNEQENSKNKKRTLLTEEKVKQFIKSISKDKSNQKMADEIELSLSTVKRLFKRYYKGEFDCLTDFKTASEKKKMRRKKYEVEKEEITRLLICNPTLTLKGMQVGLAEQGLRSSISKIYRILKVLGYTRKRLVKIPAERNSLAAINKRWEYCSEVNNLRNENLFFLDEMGFNLHTSSRYGYSLKNTKSVLTIPVTRELIFLSWR
jgi:transposase